MLMGAMQTHKSQRKTLALKDGLEGFKALISESHAI
jgi:hypothetical protein